MKIKVAEEVSSDCVSLEDGQKLFELIVPLIEEEKKVILDFQGVDVFATPFFNAGIGKLLEKYTADELRSRVTFEHLDSSGTIVLQTVINRAKEYYSKENRDAQSNIISRLNEAG